MFHFSHPWLLVLVVPAWLAYRRLVTAGGLRGGIRVGTLLVLAEIMTAQVVLSQIGNILIFVGSAIIAWLLLYRPPSSSR